MAGDAQSNSYSLEDVAAHDKADSAWIVMDDKVYDVTKFLLEHPGGEEVILTVAGKDATDEFHDVGHSSDARKMAEDYLIGHLHPEERKSSKEPKASGGLTQDCTWSDILLSPTWTNFFIPLGLSIVVYTVFKVAQKAVA